jgi:hypothetical protein
MVAPGAAWKFFRLKGKKIADRLTEQAIERRCA